MENNIEAAFEKAATAGKQEVAPVQETSKPVQAPAASEPTVAQPQGKVEPTTTPAEKQDEWDGDVNKLPPELQLWAKKVQRGFTKKAMTESELRRKGQEYLELTQSEDWKKFQSSKSQPASSVPAAPSVPEQAMAGITKEEWEAAQLDSTGQIANGLIQREISRQLNQAAQQYGMVLSSLEQKTQNAEFRTTLSEFTDLHPDIQEMYEDGIIEPILSEELKSGKHKSYEDAIASAYNRGAKIKQAAEARALSRSQGRIAEKKDAVISTGTSTGDLLNVEATDKNDAFSKAFEFAIQNKKVKVRTKR